MTTVSAAAPFGAGIPLPLPARPRTESLTSVPLSRAALPPLDLTIPPWPGELMTSGGVTLHVRRTPGPTPAAPKAVFVHGLGGSSTNWTDFAGQLSARVGGLALDLPGFGRTPPPDGYDFSMAAHTDTVVRFLSGLNEPVHLFGNSLGGVVSLAVAAQRPDLVRSLTLISPAMPDLRPDPRRCANPMMPLAFLPVIGGRVRRRLAAMTPREQSLQILRLCFAQPSLVPEHRVDQGVRETIERNGLPYYRSALAATTIGLIRSWLAPARKSVWRVVPKVEAPSLVVWGTQDRLVSVRKAPRTAQLLQRGRLLVLPRVGHCAQIERPVTVARAVLGMWEAVDRGRW
ncbi:alpha/beta fold hydrolase [Kutzneria sp. NPDC052558]|uniref:alpha/beta fold hydrolase n=1 Tax=Kutzneria sp. NPDC052558 TaxID=3364121 RepID=UPI0037CB2509